MNLFETSWNRALKRAKDQTIQLALPPPKLTLSQWANEKLYLSAEDTAEHGKYRSARAPFQVGPMDAVSDPEIETVVVMTATQMMKTTLLKSIIGYHIDQEPAPILIVQPTLDMASGFSTERLSPMIRDTPCLRGKVRDPRSRDSGNRVLHKTYIGGFLAIAGANSPASLAARPIRILLLDEVDKYKISIGKQGNPVGQALKRTKNFWDRKIVIVSSPGEADMSIIEPWYEASDKRRYHVPCPHCVDFQTLKWAQVKWPDQDPERAYYVCEFCGSILTDANKPKMLNRGDWRAELPTKKIAGFHINEIYSPWCTWGEMAVDFMKAKQSKETLQVFINTSLAEVSREKFEKADWGSLLTRRENYGEEAIPTSILYLTAGVDVQSDRLEAEIVGWRAERRGDPEESWGVKYEVLYGDPSKLALWGQLDALLKETYTTEDGRVLRIGAACIDSGGHHTAAVYAFCNQRIARHIYAIKGIAGSKPIWPKKAGKSKRHKGFLVWTIGVDTIKDVIYGRLKIAEPGPGYCHIPGDYNEEWARQLCSEKVKTRYSKGFPIREYVRVDGARAEALDARAYAYAALYSKLPAWPMLVKAAGLYPSVSPLVGADPVADAPPPPPHREGDARKPSRSVRFRFGVG